VTREHRMSLLKTLPGLLISAFFIWWTYIRIGPNGKRGFDPAAFHGLRIVSPLWIAGVVGFCVAGYGLRCVRAWWMLRSVHARFSVCSRVFLTSLAANNVLPLRIGDVMRIFTYAGDMNATPSMVLSTVILEKLLDVFSLAVFFVASLQFGGGVARHVKLVAQSGLAISVVGLLVMVLGARTLEKPLRELFAKTMNSKLQKVEHWLMLALDCIKQIGVGGTLMLVLYSLAAWLCECFMYVSIAKTIGMVSDAVGPWQAMAEANLSFLIPSSPGGIGPFELACKDAMMRHGASAAAAGLYGLLVHVWLLLVITGAGGGMFLVHRLHQARRKPLFEEIETLPAQLP
jgi:glycosyltransferase 2 family protein